MKINKDINLVMRSGKKRLLCTCSICDSIGIDKELDKRTIKQAIVFILAMFLLIVASCRLSHADGARGGLNANNAILAIIGEGESEPYMGKVALAYTILNRGTLKGVYGLHSPRVVKHLYSQATYESAKKAWEYAINNPIGDWDATGWGNAKDLVAFKNTKWFKKCHVTDHIGGHYFYACSTRP